MKMFNTKYSKIAAITLIACSAISTTSHATTSNYQATPSKVAQSQFVKSINDSRVYDTFTLENGLEVVVASDPTLKEAAVSLTVGVGQYQDPSSQLGLAHYLEHMIFQGSKNYPEPNELIKFIEANNGRFNASTESQKTSYFFSINEKHFEPALDILTDALISPSFDKTQSAKEINAIDAEWKRGKQQDSRAFHRTNAVTANPNHPMIKFSTGNLDTLSDKENSKINDELKAFYKKYYSANIMKLALVGNKPLAELKKLAEKKFSKLINNNIKRPVATQIAFKQDNLGKEIFLKTKVATDSLVLQFPLENNFTTWQNKPNKYVEYLLSSQEEGTLADSLTKSGLIEEVFSQFQPTAMGNQGTGVVIFTLTDLGKNNKDKVVATFFNYIEKIKESGINEQYANELALMLKGQFEAYQNPSALNLAVKFSRNMHSIPVRDILHFDTFYQGLDKDSVNATLNQFSTKNMRLWHISDDQKTDTQLKYADGSYRITPLKPFNSNGSLAVNLPQIMQEEQEEKIALTENIAVPQQVLETDGVEAWMMNSQHSSANQGLIALSLEGKVFNKNIKQHVLTNTLVMVLSKELQRLSTRAQQRHQVYISAMQNQYGNLSLTLAGKASKHHIYVDKLVEKIASVEITQSKLDSATKLYSESLKNLDKAPLNQQAEFHYGKTMKSSAIQWKVDELISEIKAIKLDDLLNYQNDLLTTSYVDLFAFGKYQKENVIQMANQVRSTLGTSTTKNKPLTINDYQPHAGSMLNSKISIGLDNVYLKDTYVYPEKSDETSAALIVLNKLFNAAIFKSLRTEKQLAYAVGSHVSELHKHPAFTLFIESSNTDLPTIKDNFDHFILSFFEGLKVVEESYIEQVKTSVLEKLTQKPENVYVESGVYISDWLEDNRNFDSKEKAIKLIQAVTKKDILNAYKTMLIDGHSENIIVQLKGKKQKSQPFYSYNNTAKVN